MARRWRPVLALRETHTIDRRGVVRCEKTGQHYRATDDRLQLRDEHGRRREIMPSLELCRAWHRNPRPDCPRCDEKQRPAHWRAAHKPWTAAGIRDALRRFEAKGTCR